jgi:hypothetical protein
LSIEKGEGEARRGEEMRGKERQLTYPTIGLT